jgi:hypothetical protein
MKNLSLLILTSIFLFACQKEDKQSPVKLIRDFYEGFNQGNFEAISACVSDSILMKAGDFVQANNKEDLKTFFQWDSVFSPTYTVDSIVEIEGQYVCTLTKNDKRINFLHKLPTRYNTHFTIFDNKITQVIEGDVIVFDFEKWISNREALQAWVNTNYPNYKDFMTAPGSKGAQNFRMLIELFEESSGKDSRH